MTGDIRATLAMAVLMAVIFFGFSGFPAWPETTYRAVVVSGDGEGYVVDHGLTIDDCQQISNVYCEAE